MLAHQPRLQQRVQAQRDVSVLGGVVARLVERDVGEADLALAGAGDVLVLDRLVAEMQLRQLVEPMPVLPPSST